MANNPYVNKVVYGNTTLIDITDTTAVASDVLSGKYFYNASGQKVAGSNPGGSGSGVVWQDAQGYVHLSDEGDIPLQTKSVSPSETAQVVTPDSGYYALDEVDVEAIPSNYVGSGIVRRSSSDMTASGATVTAPAGYYASSASKSVASGTAGTPTATKGTVSNHAISVTPSVSNSTGYITGGTKTGTAVTVSASELVSGTYSVTSSGTKDVTNYASISVPSGTEGTPTATKGTVSNHSVSVTPSVTNSGGYITGSTKTGTAVTVSASELVSGTLNVTENGTADVTYYESVNVNVSGGSGIKYLYSDIDGEGPWDVSGYAIANYDYTSIHDQKIRLWHEVPASSLTVTLRINGTNTVDWGDGSTSSISATTTTHEYSQAGRYCIEVTPVSGDTRLLAVVNTRQGETSNTTLKAVEYYGTSSTYYDPFVLVNSTFYNCISLEKVEFYSQHPSRISTSCFSGCTALKKVILGDTVIEIPNSAFTSCTSLNEVHLKSTTPPTTDGNNLFMYASTDLKIYVPVESLSAYQTATYWSTYASQMIGE